MNMYGFCSQTMPPRGALFHPLSQTPRFLKIGASRKAIRAIASNFLQRPNYQKNIRNMKDFNDSNPDLLQIHNKTNGFSTSVSNNTVKHMVSALRAPKAQ